MAREFSVVVGINATRARTGARQFKAGADQVNRSNRGMQRSTAKTTRRMTAMITTLGRIRGVATVAFAGFLGVGGISAVTRTITEFTGALSKVEALLGPRAIGGAMTALENKARSLGATTVFTATQAAEGMQFLTLAGFDALEVFQAIEPALTLAQAGALGLGQAADIVSNIMAGFSIEAEKTGQVVDALAFVASRTNTNIQQLGEAMKFVAPVAGAVGISVEETAAALGILGNAGLQASLAGTSLRRVFSGLLNPSKEASEVLDGMGLVAGDLVAKIGRPGGLNEVIHILAERGLGAAEAFTLFGQRGAPGILSLINQKDKLGAMNITMKDIVGTAKDMATVMTDNLGGDARLAISALQEGILQLGDAGLTEWLRDTTQGFGGFIRGLTDVKVNMFEATDAMKDGIAAGKAFKDNLDTVQQALFIFITFLSRNALRALGLFIGQLALATAATAGFGSSVIRLGVSANTTRVALLRMRTALVSTGVGIAVVAVGLLAQKLFEMWSATNDVVDANEAAEQSFQRLSDEVNIAAFNFESFTNAEREAAVTSLNKVIDGQVIKLQELSEAAVDAEASQLLLPPAQERLKEATEALNEVYGEGFDIQTIYAEAGSANASKLIEFRDAQDSVNGIVKEFGSTTLNEVLPGLERMDRNLEINQERLRVWNLMLKDSNLTMREATDIIRGVEDARDLLARKLKEETGLLEDEFMILQALLKKYGEVKTDISDLQNAYQITATALATMIANGKGATESAEKLRIVLVNLGIAMDKETSKAAKKMADEFKKIDDRLNPLPALTRKFNEEALILAQTIGTDTPEAVARLRAELAKLRGEYDENIKKILEVCDKNKEVRECTEDTAKKMEAIWDRAMSNIQDTFADAFRNIGDGFDSFADGILDAFKDLLANMAAQAAITNFFGGGGGNGFFNDFISGLGGGGSSGGSGGSSGGGNVGGLLTNLFGNGNSGGSGSFWGSLTSIFSGGGSSTTALPALWESPAAFAQGVPGSLGTTTTTGATTGAGGNIPFFSEFASAFSTSTQGGAGVWASIGEGFSAGFSSISVAGWIAIAMAFNQGLYSSGWRPETGDLGEFHTNPIFGQPGFAGEALRGLGVSEELATLFAGDAVTTRLFGRKAPRATGSGVSLGFEDGRLVGEGFTDWIAKGGVFRSDKRGRDSTVLSDEFLSQLQGGVDMLFAPFLDVVGVLGGSVEDLLDFDLASSDLNLQEFDKKGRPKFSDEQLGQMLNDFLSESVTDAVSNFLRTTDSIAEEFKATILQFEGDSERFMSAMQLIASINAAGEFDFGETIAASLEEAGATAFDVMENNIAILRQVIAAYDGSFDSLVALEAAYGFVTASQFELVAALTALGMEISSMFQDSAQTIRESLLSEEELYNLRRVQIDDLIAQASMSTDPVELQSLAQEINRLGVAAFNLLESSQQSELAPEFIEFFDGLDEMFGEQIAQSIEGIVDEQAALDQEVATAMQAAAQSIVDTNRAARRLYDTWREDLALSARRHEYAP